MTGNNYYLTEKPNKALFLDRDGVLIEYVPYLSHPNQVRIPVGAGETLKKWQDAGYLLIVITNQSGVARGYFSMRDVEAVHTQMCQEYERFNVKFQDIFMCPHQPSDNCKCRKPSPQMIFEASEKHLVEISHSFFIGDAFSDIECAVNAGCNPILLLTSRTEAKTKILSHHQATIHLVNEVKETVRLIPV
jgi:D-glycero-D-manno-heptose 1,7-bisphosphate phosphatase